MQKWHATVLETKTVLQSAFGKNVFSCHQVLKSLLLDGKFKQDLKVVAHLCVPDKEKMNSLETRY